MAFRVNNLIIQVLPDANAQPPQQVTITNAGAPWFSWWIPPPPARQGPVHAPEANTQPPQPVHAPDANTQPPQQSTTTNARAWFPWWGPPAPNSQDLASVSDPTVLSALKVQLQATLNAVEEQEKSLDEQTSIHTVEEAQTLEDQLTAALAEVRRQKQQLQDKGAKV